MWMWDKLSSSLGSWGEYQSWVWVCRAHVCLQRTGRSFACFSWSAQTLKWVLMSSVIEELIRLFGSICGPSCSRNSWQAGAGLPRGEENLIQYCNALAGRWCLKMDPTIRNLLFRWPHAVTNPGADLENFNICRIPLKIANLIPYKLEENTGNHNQISLSLQFPVRIYHKNHFLLGVKKTITIIPFLWNWNWERKSIQVLFLGESTIPYDPWAVLHCI